MDIRAFTAAASDRLKRARIPDPRREAESLLAHALGKDEAWVVAHPEARPAAAAAKAYAAMVARRAAHEPFAYVVGHRWFYGRRFRVTKDVLVPRPETELLVEAILERAPKASATILDVGTGSGAIGLTLAAELPKAKTVLYDVSARALAVAKENAKALKLGRRVRLAKLDIRKGRLPEPTGPVILAANLPYLPLAQWKSVAPEVRREPKLALASGKDGLDHYRALIGALARWQRAPDLLALEAEPGQFAELARMTERVMPGTRVTIIKDLHGDERILIAEKRKRP
jgi:release factor glutamine methyltransferase